MRCGIVQVLSAVRSGTGRLRLGLIQRIVKVEVGAMLLQQLRILHQPTERFGEHIEIVPRIVVMVEEFFHAFAGDWW